MPISVHVLSSSSAGNCALVETDRTRFLIDAGLSGRQIVSLLAQAGKPIETVEAVFLTHEHSDHVAGLRGLAKFRHLKFFANLGTAQGARGRAGDSLQWMLFETGNRFQFADVTVETMLLPHDAMEPVGYVFRTGDGSDLFQPPQSLAWITDLGYIPPALAAFVRDVDLLMLEANHCPELLEADEKRPWAVKQRIRGRHGHLSNEAAAAFLQSVPQPAWRHILLGHLSRDCNTLEQLQTAMAAHGNQPAQHRWQLHCLCPVTTLFPPVVLDLY